MEKSHSANWDYSRLRRSIDRDFLGVLKHQAPARGEIESSVTGSASLYVWLYLPPNVVKKQMAMLHDYGPQDPAQETGRPVGGFVLSETTPRPASCDWIHFA